MKLIKEGRPQKGWAKEQTCTGAGNKGGGCGATLLVEQGDLYLTHRGGSNYGDDNGTPCVTFQCMACGVETDVEPADWPPRAHDLPPRSKVVR